MRYALAIAGLAAAAQAGNTYTITATEDVTITSCAPTHTNCPYKSGANEWEVWATTSSNSRSSDPTETWAPWDPSKPSTTSRSSTISRSASASSSGTWGPWDPSQPSTTSRSASVSSSGTWAPWDPSTSTRTPVVSTTTQACPQYTATAPPAWFSQLPTSVLSSLAAKWTGAPPSDWCYYSYSASSVSTSTRTPVASTGTPVAVSSTWAEWSSGAASGSGAASSSGAGVRTANPTTSGPIAKYTGAANANAASFVLGGAAAIAAVILA